MYGFVTYMLALVISDIMETIMERGMLPFYITIFVIGWLVKTLLGLLLQNNE